METRKIYLNENDKELILAALGNPYFLIVEKERKDDVKVYSKVTEGFDIGYIFEWIIAYAREDEEFKKALADFVIDLSKEV